MNQVESQERAYLQEIKDKLQDTLESINSKIRDYAKQIREQKTYLWENKTGMDHVEKISVRQSVDQFVLTAEAVRDKSRRIQKLLKSPYFGRFDFQKREEEKAEPIYIGVHAYFDETTNKSLIHDWRAPISTMFYDYETGPAKFEAPEGEVEGTILLKRQYRIRNGEMDFMLESDLNIHDDVLQKELSLSSDDKMKNIVATIQRDQNAIIRNEDSSVLIIQGVAGSGKTSIALHRIAFLLYRFKDTIKSSDILIISPNKVFADYISNVLPELGEEKIPEIGIEELANELLEREFKFQSFFDQVATLLKKTDKAYQKRIKYKASIDFLKKLDEYAQEMKTSFFDPEDIWVNGRLVPKWFLSERFEAINYLPIVKRLEKLAKDIEANIGIQYSYDLSSEERRKLREAVKRAYKHQSLRGLYKDFYVWMGEPQLCKFIQGKTLEYADVFPMIYLKMHWQGLKTYENVKHLLVDEMQDYTPVQYAVLSKLFECRKTILGDANQSVNPFSSSSADGIKRVFDDADCVKLNKSYRSTYEITNFAQSISANKDLEVIERHGEEPQLFSFEDEANEIARITKLIDDFVESDHHSLGIIAKTENQAQRLFEAINCDKTKLYLLTSDSGVFRQGVVVLTAHMAKGLEFDHVIVPQATKENYKSEVDKSMLYVACTRAMHKLTLTFSGEKTAFIH